MCGWQRAKKINNICVAYVSPTVHNNRTPPVLLWTLGNTMPLQYVAYTDANRPEKKDQALKPSYVYCMAKLSIKHLFISCGL